MCIVCVEYVCIGYGGVEGKQKYISVILDPLESQPVVTTKLVS